MEKLNFKTSEVKPFIGDPEDGLEYSSELEPNKDNFKAEAGNIVEDFEMSSGGNVKFLKTIDELIEDGKITTWNQFGEYVDGVVLMIQNQ